MSTRILYLGTMFCCLSALALGGCSGSDSEDGGVAAASGSTGTGGGGGGTAVPLEIDGEWVDGTTNTYGIQGAFYTYSDSDVVDATGAPLCPGTVVTWDPLTRCASGTLSLPGADWSCWGMGVGFDLNNSGAEGVPPNVVNPWDAVAHGVAGIAWEWSGNAPGLGVWVTQAEPTVMPDCPSETVNCAIDGPPDGMANAPNSGSITWDSSQFVKADWGGEGTPYVFDPTQILAIEFALDSAEGTPLAFDFCINSVSVIPAQ